jgi:hypothetical protein
LIGDKNPAYSFVIPKILSVFPEAKFIHIIRDYRDHILSMQKVDFGSRLTPFTALKWRRCQKVIEKQKKIVPNRFVTIKYEELVTNTSENIKEICNFLSVDFLPDILNFHNYKEDFLITYKDDGIEQYHSSLMQPINTSKIKTWKVKMPEKEIKMADMVVGRWAEKYGYERKYNGTYPLLYLYLLPIYVHIIVQRFLGLFVRMLPHKAMNKVVYRNSIFEKLYEKIYIKLRGQKS